MEEMHKLRELRDGVRREMVAGHAAASLAFLSDLLLSPNNELASARKANEDLTLKNEKLTAEVARWKVAAETAERTRDTVAAEVTLSKQANAKLNRELNSMAKKLEEAKGDRDDFRAQYETIMKEKAEF